MINLTKVGVVATDETSALLLRSLVWGSEQKIILKEQTDTEAGKVS